MISKPSTVTLKSLRGVETGIGSGHTAFDIAARSRFGHLSPPAQIASAATPMATAPAADAATNQYLAIWKVAGEPELPWSETGWGSMIAPAF